MIAIKEEILSDDPLWQLLWIGSCSYEEGLLLQEKFAAKKKEGDPKNYILLLEHEPTYTIGRTLDQSSLGTKKLPYPLYTITRGGQATYHGPGQLVVYPIIHLSLINKDLHRYLRVLEEAILKTMKEYSLIGSRKEGMTGVWVEDRKIASLGVGVRQWIAFHGIGLNVSNDLTPFSAITPCGLEGVTMTSLQRELPHFKDSVKEVGIKLNTHLKAILLND